MGGEGRSQLHHSIVTNFPSSPRQRVLCRPLCEPGQLLSPSGPGTRELLHRLQPLPLWHPAGVPHPRASPSQPAQAPPEKTPPSTCLSLTYRHPSLLTPASLLMLPSPSLWLRLTFPFGLWSTRLD